MASCYMVLASGLLQQYVNTLYRSSTEDEL